MRATVTPTRRLIPLTEAAEILAVSVKTVRRYVAGSGSRPSRSSG